MWTCFRLEAVTAMQDVTEWFLVVNATRARVLRSLPKPGDTADPELVMRAPSKGLRAMIAGSKADRNLTFVNADERAFIGQVVALLESHRMAGDFTRLTIFAAQHILNLLRQETPATLRARIGQEFPKDFVGFSEKKLPERIRQAISESRTRQ